MARGKDVRDSKGNPVEGSGDNEVVAMMFILIEQAPGAYKLRFVQNEDLLKELRKNGVFQEFLKDADQLYTDFRHRIDNVEGSKRPN